MGITAAKSVHCLVHAVALLGCIHHAGFCEGNVEPFHLVTNLSLRLSFYGEKSEDP